MDRRIPIALALLALLSAAGAGAEEAKAPTGDDEKTIYALGVSLAGNLESFTLSPAEVEFLVAGLRDGLAGREPKVAMSEYGPRIRTLAQSRSTAAAEVEKKAGAEFLAKEASAPGATKSASGLVKRVLKEGSGPTPAKSDRVKVHYTGTLRDGSVFDSSVERGEPAEFPLERVVPCWTEALQTMKVGEKAHIACPSETAYGDKGAPPRIRPGAALAFDVELLEIVQAPASPPTTP
jgi:FKBP-type peptidyl-prolyl cis-trans isomerase